MDLQVPMDMPGMMRNAGCRQTTGSLLCWLDEGDVPSSRFFECVLEAMRRQPQDFVVPLAFRTAAGTNRLVVPATELPTLLSTSDRTPIGPVLARSVWDNSGGFDGELPALDEYEFWIRLLAKGGRGHVLNRVLVSRPDQGPDADPEQTTKQIEAAATLVLGRHWSSFAQDPASVIVSRMRDRAHLDSHYQSLMERRQNLLAEHEANTREIRELERYLTERGADSADFGDLRNVWPVSSDWGYERGTPVDRVYIEEFLAECSEDVAGRVLEVQESDLTRKFGGDRVQQVDVIDINHANPLATMVADLRDARAVPSDTFDCFILTQTLHVIDDMSAVLREAYRVLKPGGVLLATLPCASRVCLEYGPQGDFWRVTEAGARTLFEQVFPTDMVQTRAFGNVLTNVAFLIGLASHELSAAEYASYDPYFPLLIGVRAVKPGGAPVVRAARNDAASQPTVLLYHRVAQPEGDVHGLAVPERIFRQQLEHLMATRVVLPLDDLVREAELGKAPSNAVALTFDDGYRDNLDTVAPLLVSLGLPATFFVTTQAFEGQTEYWWDALERALLGSATLPLTLDVTIAGERRVFATASEADRKQSHDVLHKLLVKASLQDREMHLARILQSAGAPATGFQAPLLTAHEVQRLASLPGCAIGTHTAHHLALGHQSAAVVGRELEDSCNVLESLLKRPVTALAYPYGDYTSETVEVVRAASLQIGATCDAPGAVPFDRLKVPRLEVKAWPVAEFKRRIANRQTTYV
jgi:peptidoglycan/xylan/chitin deacetylase (PgdA/CDA1 family)/SAM-dependent methyltransferase